MYKISLDKLLDTYQYKNEKQFSYYLHIIYQSLSESNKDLPILNLSQYLKVPYIFLKKVFAGIEISGYITFNLFSDFMKSIYLHNYANPLKFIFSFLSDKNSFTIHKSDMLFYYFCLRPDPLSDINKVKKYIDDFFVSYELSYSDYIKLIFGNFPDIFIMPLIYLLERRPFSEDIFSFFQTNNHEFTYSLYSDILLSFSIEFFLNDVVYSLHLLKKLKTLVRFEEFDSASDETIEEKNINYHIPFSIVNKNYLYMGQYSYSIDYEIENNLIQSQDSNSSLYSNNLKSSNSFNTKQERFLRNEGNIFLLIKNNINSYYGVIINDHLLLFEDSRKIKIIKIIYLSSVILCNQISIVLNNTKFFKLEILIREKRFDFYFKYFEDLTKWKNLIPLERNIKDHYIFTNPQEKMSVSALKIKDSLKYSISIFKKNQSYDNIIKILEIQSRLNNKHIARFIDHFQDETYFYLIYEYIDGGTLTQYLQTNKITLNKSILVEISYQISLCIEYLHNLGIVHRDLKPDSFAIMNFENICLKLINLDMCVFFNRKIVDICGTIPFVAPEVFINEYYESVDIWSFGIILYYIFCEKLPFNDYSKFMSKTGIKWKLLNVDFNNYNICDKIKNLICLCLIDNECRINIREVIEKLKIIL